MRESPVSCAFCAFWLAIVARGATSLRAEVPDMATAPAISWPPGALLNARAAPRP
jgi:hypothetical protein